MFTRVKVHRDFHAGVTRSVDSAPREYLGCLDARADSALVKLLHHGVLVKTLLRLRCEDECLSGPPRRGFPPSRQRDHQDCVVATLDALLIPAGSGGNDHG